MKKTSTSARTASPAALGAGIAALAAAAAGAYYLYGSKKAPQNRKALKGWMLRMKADVMEEIENLKDLNADAYHAAVATISDKYKRLKNVDPAEVAALAERMRGHWKDIQKDINQTSLAPKPKKAKARSKK